MRRLFIFAVIVLTPLLASSARAQEADDFIRQIRALGWVDGPTRIPTVGDATIEIPQGFTFLGDGDTGKFLTLMQNPPSPVVHNLFAPESLSWFAVLSYSDDGYVEDDEAIDADALLKSISEGTEADNAERKRNGWTELHVTGWRQPPHYDESSRRLEWALDLSDGTQVSTNFQTRILGRRGVTAATLVTDPSHLANDLAVFRQLVAGYDFDPGGDYAEYQEGDKVAEYGLMALIAGGAAAVAAKTGFFAKFLKFILIGGAAILAGAVGLFRRMFGGRTS